MSQPAEQKSESAYPDQILEGHEYDGIKEYDNPMPAWWLWLFYATVIWSVFYIAALGAGWIDDYDAQLERNKERIAEKRAAAEEDAVAVDEEFLAGFVDDADALETGGEMYATTCAACHGAEGEGGVGPAFDDGQWIHGDDLVTHFEVTRDGIPAEGMPAHEGQFDAEELASIVAFINSL